MRILYQFPLSHYCEKARWLLDHKELDFEAHNLILGVHRAFAQLKTGQNKLPILKDQEKYIADSTQIALYLDEVYPEHSLLRSDQILRQQALEINHLANELGVYVRRFGLAHALAQGDEPIDILIGEQGYLRQFEKFSKPILKKLVSKGYQLDDEKIADAKIQMQKIIEILNEKLIENGARYFVGDRLGLADIAVCSMIAPLLGLVNTPWEKDHDTVTTEEFDDYQQALLEMPIGQYVQRIYLTERNARVDWRGV
ncbi:glutathione S-transferase family protein [Acinetobacter stercoris]|uniref:Glutaredoxin 2 n=1 Tax=Acinetobacter stercoris TaxID=2126983 RepID=A0A2U3N1F3_9GAMM|nr:MULTISPECIES: glutathione S-transferase [Acinetobacter]SPL71507.1 glutaredoxin 2 [Acinetobacter stercoris]